MSDDKKGVLVPKWMDPEQQREVYGAFLRQGRLFARLTDEQIANAYEGGPSEWVWVTGDE